MPNFHHSTLLHDDIIWINLLCRVFVRDKRGKVLLTTSYEAFDGLAVGYSHTYISVGVPYSKNIFCG